MLKTIGQVSLLLELALCKTPSSVTSSFRHHHHQRIGGSRQVTDSEKQYKLSSTGTAAVDPTAAAFSRPTSGRQRPRPGVFLVLNRYLGRVLYRHAATAEATATTDVIVGRCQRNDVVDAAAKMSALVDVELRRNVSFGQLQRRRYHRPERKPPTVVIDVQHASNSATDDGVEFRSRSLLVGTR